MLNQFKDEISKSIYGMSKSEALQKNICVDCKKPITGASFKTDAGVREYRISALCEYCWDAIFFNDK